MAPISRRTFLELGCIGAASLAVLSLTPDKNAYAATWPATTLSIGDVVFVEKILYAGGGQHWITLPDGTRLYCWCIDIYNSAEAENHTVANQVYNYSAYTADEMAAIAYLVYHGYGNPESSWSYTNTRAAIWSIPSGATNCPALSTSRSGTYPGTKADFDRIADEGRAFAQRIKAASTPLKNTIEGQSVLIMDPSTPGMQHIAICAGRATGRMTIQKQPSE